MYAFFVPLAVLLAVTVKRAMTLSSILSFSAFVLIIASPVFYRLLYVSEPYRALLLLNPLTHIVVVLRSGSGLQEGFPAVSSIALLTLMSSALWVLLWYKLRGGVFTIIEKRS
jgi:ABC-type polysaccharide/polyol phosphate export permease